MNKLAISLLLLLANTPLFSTPPTPEDAARILSFINGKSKEVVSQEVMYSASFNPNNTFNDFEIAISAVNRNGEIVSAKDPNVYEYKYVLVAGGRLPEDKLGVLIRKNTADPLPDFSNMHDIGQTFEIPIQFIGKLSVLEKLK